MRLQKILWKCCKYNNFRNFRIYLILFTEKLGNSVTYVLNYPHKIRCQIYTLFISFQQFFSHKFCLHGLT